MGRSEGRAGGAGLVVAHGGGELGTTERVRRLEQLRNEFARFRAGHRGNTRIPDTLRAAAVAAYRGGTTAWALRRACGVSSEQLAQWCAQMEGTAPAGSTGQMAQQARVFPVVDRSDRSGSPEVEQTGWPQELELRLGSWAISVRQLGLGDDR